MVPVYGEIRLEELAAEAGAEAGAAMGGAAGRVAADAAVGAADAGDHIVLDLRSAGTQDLADQIGGRTLLSDPAWQETLQKGIADAATKFSVNLDGSLVENPF